ncbi:MAG: 4-(cytidine 5'-diphospho)-2-C-methyl-D-erythritol kinase [Firmicutes bacterium]|jgi:4-diphosphocytidyl-2-C-methyl-D-erythritol kinase|nr:4-(cytidine 5'-diphospho)-2-C-methyl-D-erythritol kinase [Bacillota bacterium]
MTEIYLRAYGKINLSLDVTGVREDGYHQVETVMQRISLYDKIHIRWEPETEPLGKAAEFSIDVKTNRVYLPTDRRNLAYQAAMLMIERFGKEVGGGRIEITISKSIPVAAGLAGGSSNCAAVLIGLNRLWGVGLTTRQLCRLGETLGTDVPFCILNQNTRYRAALGTGRGERLRPIRRAMRAHLVLAKPPFGVSTKEVFSHIDEYEIANRPDSRALMKSMASGDHSLVYDHMINVLELYTLKRYEPVRRLKEIMTSQTEAEMALMSGSGPTVFAVYRSERAARRACEKIRTMGYEAYWANTMDK